MSDDLATALDEVRHLLLDRERLVRARAGGSLPGQQPTWRTVELRPVAIKGGERLQVVTYDDRQSFTSNHRWGDPAARTVDDLLEQPFGHWHVWSTDGEIAVRVTRSGRVLSTRTGAASEQQLTHDRAKRRLVDASAPFLLALGLTDDSGHVKKSKADKLRQVEQFVRILDASVREARAAGRLMRSPLQVIDLGCGNAYLTFAVYHHLHDVLGLDVRVVGVDVKRQAREHNRAVADTLGWSEAVTFVEGAIDSVDLSGPVDVVVALHACDTATDDALSRAIQWECDLILAAPCCQHDLQRQLRDGTSPGPYRLVTRNGLMRERLADVLTESFRAHLLRRSGYRADVVEFVDSEHTPRNVLLRAHRTDARPTAAQETEYAELVEAWGVSPRLEVLLTHPGGQGTRPGE
jgi:SAM-dependent methyltransferase